MDHNNTINTVFEETNMSEYSCVICLEPYTDDSNGFVSPCYCRGSMYKIHKKCVKKYIQVTKKVKCPTCGYPYKFTKKRNSLWKSIRTWYFGNDDSIERIWTNKWV
ncbi:E3 ubiquitin-protein ligase MARCH8-like [Sipha flava]|uniref:E3 ubiquitin-protein ligase MARCH8-like n=1 Tax=Sipha flava TaxID=143950 RepID=A0A8B8GQK4_9HEMI|nr:E3 ubiquitin-protein ligase MARCH8-like [Sipha flava]